MAHKVGRAVMGKAPDGSDRSGGYWSNLGNSFNETGGDMWDTYTGKLDDPNQANWTNQDYNADWNTTGQNYTPGQLGPAGQAGAVGYGDNVSTYGGTAAQMGYDSTQLGNAQGYTGQGYNASQLGNAQGYGAQGYNAAQGTATMGNFQTGAASNAILGQAMSASQDFMDPSSNWAKGQQSLLAESTGQQAGQAQAQQSAQLAARGMGGGGLRSMLGSQAQATAGAAQRQGATDIATQGAGLGLQALGQAGQMATAQESNMLQQGLANQAASNQMGLANMSAQNQASQFGAGAANTAAQFGAGAQNQFSMANQAAMNQASQFGAQAQNTAMQFGAGQQNQFSLANQAASNQASQFGQQAANTAAQWNAGQQNQAAQFGAQAQNTANMFNTGQSNQFATNQFNANNTADQFNAQQNQAANQFNVGNQMNWDSWNASQGFAADQFNASQQNAVDQANTAGQASAWQGIGSMATSAASAKGMFLCLPEGTKIDTPNGRTKVEDLKAGDTVNGYGTKPVTVMQKHEYNENPEIKRFLKIFFDDGDAIDCCDMHRIKDIRAKEYNVNDTINGKRIVDIKWYDGVERSYDLLTEDGGYRISGIPVNSMIEEMMSLISLTKEIM